MAKPSTSVQARLTHLLKHWPRDTVRPEAVSVQTYLQQRLAQIPQDPSTSSTKKAISPASLNALSSLLEDRYTRRYPLPQKLRYPASNPSHYDDLVREFEEAPNRDFWKRLGKAVSGLIRLR
ncbi:hypothetical protein ASPZODRAFT_140142 [Penicilliopsis zonata CBS 506.65]|uniref:Ubiquinol-cytochrome-c reductase complex assembly factor 2 n=1 Tax=Penicilliopsis zonata CBS 506.65 TaxID=1073090 RepID=A0A1L9SQ71_9EURO|nr:hypothetical protein ASPZODRAFT_140142 [Penicilliopsis zonata CBS 506.65]OJJ49214.1 hypothetical protein ASPZODRAFT_140142 [Penicilliopsis zonata CBS 506.65]